MVFTPFEARFLLVAGYSLRSLIPRSLFITMASAGSLSPPPKSKGPELEEPEHEESEPSLDVYFKVRLLPRGASHTTTIPPSYTRRLVRRVYLESHTECSMTSTWYKSKRVYGADIILTSGPIDVPLGWIFIFGSRHPSSRR
jgi:hypothetical protein